MTIRYETREKWLSSVFTREIAEKLDQIEEHRDFGLTAYFTT
jgi:hypothetical protein